MVPHLRHLVPPSQSRCFRTGSVNLIGTGLDGIVSAQINLSHVIGLPVPMLVRAGVASQPPLRSGSRVAQIIQATLRPHIAGPL
jgi:hypothetical protein